LPPLSDERPRRAHYTPNVFTPLKHVKSSRQLYSLSVAKKSAELPRRVPRGPRSPGDLFLSDPTLSSQVPPSPRFSLFSCDKIPDSNDPVPGVPLLGLFLPNPPVLPVGPNLPHSSLLSFCQASFECPFYSFISLQVRTPAYSLELTGHPEPPQEVSTFCFF